MANITKKDLVERYGRGKAINDTEHIACLFRKIIFSIREEYQCLLARARADPPRSDAPAFGAQRALDLTTAARGRPPPGAGEPRDPFGDTETTAAPASRPLCNDATSFARVPSSLPARSLCRHSARRPCCCTSKARGSARSRSTRRPAGASQYGFQRIM